MRKLILTSQCLEMLALSVWIGGLLVLIGAVIPAVFNSIGMEPGGRMLTKSFQGYDRIVLLAAGLLIAGMMTRSWVTSETGAVGNGEVLVVIMMIVVACVLAFLLNPEVVRLQELAFAAKDAESKRVAYGSFFTYHWIARALYLVNLALGITVLCIKVRKWAR